MLPLPCCAVLAMVALTAMGARAEPSRSLPGRRAVTSHAQMVRQWHAPAPLPPLLPRDNAQPPLVLEMVNTSESLALTPTSERGGFSADDLARASRALRDPRSNEEHPVDPRLLDLAYRIQLHFRAPSVRVISAFRVPHGRSKHGMGRALDFVVPGTRDDQVARFARTLGFVGVGVYPRSGFVHVDSRPRSYFWIDASGPGQRALPQPILANLAARSDAKARAAGETPPHEANEEADSAGELTAQTP